jgi:hypothetical protein
VDKIIIDIVIEIINKTNREPMVISHGTKGDISGITTGIASHRLSI